jgi:hypothetical protein
MKGSATVKNRFSAVEVENGKWKVFDAHERAYVWECRTEEDARKFADAKNAKERLRNAKVVSISPNIKTSTGSPAH